MTVVHPMDEVSPLYGKSPEDLAERAAEIMVLIRGFDDTFSQVVNARSSYRHDEILWAYQSKERPACLRKELNRLPCE